MIQRIRTLAVQSANGTNTDSDRAAIQKEVHALDEEITRIADKTTFNGQQILSGLRGQKAGQSMLDAQGNIKFQVGSNSNDTLDVNLKEGFSTSEIVAEGLKNSDIKISVQAVKKGENFIEDVIEVGTDTVSGTADKLDEGKLYRSLKDPTKYYVATSTANSKDTGFINGDVNDTSLLANAKDNSVTVFNGTDLEKILRGSGDNGEKGQGAALLKDAFGITNIKNTAAANKVVGAPAKLEIDISKAQASQGMIALSDGMLNYIDGKRADLGAAQNRMESTIRNQASIAENTSDARARIRDTDFAEETAKLSQQTIIQQAAQSMLMQANQRPQMALSLLG